VIKGAGALALASALGPIGCASAPDGRPTPAGGRAFSDDPFGLGVASGDPLPDRVVLWTRLVPRPLEEGGGMGEAPVAVRWQIAHDERFTRIVAQGEAQALAEHAHSVHVDAAGLSPARGYFYRFIAAGVASPTGRTRTAPAAGADAGLLRLASVGCQNYEAGYYTAYRHLADEDLDLVIHTGDYIYERAARKARGDLVRYHPAHESRTLAQYRLRYALYKSDADLQAAHAAHPFAVIFDDHEVVNDWNGDMRSREFLERRAAGFRAWWEHMPVRAALMPQGGAIRIYRTLDYGRLARINLCDTRQHRTRQPCGGGTVERCGAESDPRAQMLGALQEAWLFGQLQGTPARWNVVAQQVLMAEMNRARPDQAPAFDMDKWDGYRAARQRLLDLFASGAVANPVVLTGDIHRHIAVDLRPDCAQTRTGAVAVELVNTSISSRGDGGAKGAAPRSWQANNPHVRYTRDRRGYIRHVIGRDGWQADFRVLDYVSRPGAPIRTDRSFVVEAGRSGLLSA
jgi:alkaline phosphatase D